MKGYKYFLSILTLLVLVACGGDSSSDSDSDSDFESGSDSKNRIGVFLDSPVINISYKTDTLEGTTNHLGEYEYVEGESVTFFIGDLIFPAVDAKSTVTPFDLAGTSDIDASEVVNITRLLQTLDKDGDPDNGITIDDTAKLTAMPVDFFLTASEFASSSIVTSLIMNAGQDNVVTELVSSVDAIAHFQQQLSDAYYSSDMGASTSSPITITENIDSSPFRSTFSDDGAVTGIWFKLSPSTSSDYKITRTIIDASPLDEIPSSVVSIASKSAHLQDCVNGMDEKVQSCTFFMNSNTDYYFNVRSFDNTKPLFTLLIEKL